jgi:lysozyme
MTMKMSPIGRKRLEAREGVRLKAYKDTKGIWTIAVGHTSAAGEPKVTPGLTITQSYEATVNACVKVPLAQHEFDALVSVCFNIGQPGFAKSTMVRRINAGDRPGTADAIMMWNKPKEIVGRRLTEKAQFLTPYTASEQATEPPSAAESDPGLPSPPKTTDGPPGGSQTPSVTKGFLGSLIAFITSITRRPANGPI